jgi:hypothetical protein
MPNGYSFVSHTINQKTVFFAGFDRNYDQISIEFNIRRRATYFIRLISWPASILLLLTLTLFFLPPSACERIIYGKNEFTYLRIIFLLSISGGLLLLCQFILLAIFAFYIPKRLGTTWPWMGRTIFYNICLTTMALIFSVLVRMLSNGKHYSAERPPIKIRTVCMRNYRFFKSEFLGNF